MTLPISLKTALEEYATKYSFADLKEAAQSISQIYRNTKRSGLPLVTSDREVVAYALTRMPATFAVLSKVLENIKPAKTMIDVGAGTGSATWAALEKGIATDILCLEKEDKMRQIGSDLMRKAYPFVKWQSFDLAKDFFSFKADLVVASYVLNELDKDVQLKAAERLWQATEQNLVIIEPGTPVGFEIISKIRTYLIGKGAFVVAPCPHDKECPLAQNDWCHFTCRLERNQMHKMLKSGDAPYEDEKFSYLILSRQPTVRSLARVLRHPDIEKGNINLQLCTFNGLEKRTVTRKEKQSFKAARKANAGDEWKE